jgi:DNA-binding protein HU-beta
MAKKEAAKKEVAKKAPAKNSKKDAGKPLTKAQFITALAEKSELPKKTVAELLENLLELAYSESKKSHGFVLHGLGKLVVADRAARTVKIPKTGEARLVPAKKVLKFRIAKQAKDAVIGVAAPAPAPSKKK